MALPQKGVAYDFYTPLVSVANTPAFQVNPTIAAGDFKISKDGGSFNNLATLPVVTPAGSRMVKISLSATEMTADKVVVQCVDVAGAEWEETMHFIDVPLFNVDGVWDRVLTGSTHNIRNSAGRRLRGMQEFQGYEGGAVWIDTVNGVSGTDLFESGTVDNPVDNMDDANTIAVGVGLSTFYIYPESSITFTATQSHQVFKGVHWTLNLNGQNIEGSSFEGAIVSGIATGIGTDQTYRLCEMGVTTHIKNTRIIECAIEGTQTVGEAGDYFFDRCHSAIAGTSTWIFNFGTVIGNTNLNWRAGSGGIQLESMGDAGTDTASIEGWGQLIEGTCTGGTVAIRGNITVSGITNLTLSDDARIDKSSVANVMWDEILTGSLHNIQNSAGKRLRDIASQAIHTDTANGPAVNGNQIELADAASDVDGAYDPAMITIIDGTGAGQTRMILQYNGVNRIATVDRNWKVNPDATSEYIVFSHPGREHVNEGLAQGGTINSITLNSLASSSDNAYEGQVIFIRSGTGEDQSNLVVAYDGTTKIATIHEDWAITPDDTSGYVMLPLHVHLPITVAEAVWNKQLSEHQVTGSAGKKLDDNMTPNDYAQYKLAFE